MTTPEPVMKGTFALYEAPGGGRVLAYRLAGEEDTRRIIIPAAIIKLMEAQQRGEKISPMAMIKSMMGG